MPSVWSAWNMTAKLKIGKNPFLHEDNFYEVCILIGAQNLHPGQMTGKGFLKKVVFEESLEQRATESAK